MNTSVIIANTSNVVVDTNVATSSNMVVTTAIPYELNTAAHIQDDYAFARKNLYDIMAIGIKGMEELANIATASQHMRAYEAMAQLIKSVGETNDKLLVLQNNRQALQDHDTEETTPGKVVINSGNTVFVGTAAELQEMIRNKISNGS